MTWERYPSLSDEQLRSLGLLTWEAIKLEGVMDQVCEQLRAGSTASGTIRQHLNKAILGMVEGETPARTAAKNWLEASYEALEVRNITFHSTTTGSYNEKNGALVLEEIQLINQKLMKDGSTRKLVTALSAAGFLAHQATLAHAYSGWHRVDLELAVESQARSV